MPSLDEIRDILKQMTEEQRLELIRLCNLENTKLQIDKVYLQFNNNHRCPYCNSNKIKKNGLYAVKYNNLNVITVIKTIQLKQTQYFIIHTNQLNYGKSILNYFHKVYHFVRLLKK